ncbi:hypothetical protein [Bacillus cereus group sp. BfR-BA-01524]|uniref:hypothetical protein n=1 Tax=Bacillus cereus group sp. BfR-BA-01524 TaxID=2920372 RepID=UPI001F596CA1
MNHDQKFINLILDCEYIIKQNILLNELRGLIETVKKKRLNNKLYYLSITQMIDKSDPDEVITAVLKLNEFYCKYYQKL